MNAIMKKNGRTANKGIQAGIAKDMQEAYAFLDGAKKKLRRFTTETYRIADPGIAKAARAKMQLSQPKFAEFVNTSASTVRAWEQGTRRPDGVASVLLELIRENPEKMRALLEEHKLRVLKMGHSARA
jgi:DNA-binding transcriptional regulator YiaG